MPIYQTQGKYGGASKAVADLFNTMGAYEKMRRELKLQESFLRKASEGDKDFPTIIRELTEEQAKPSYSSGFAGAMQRLGGAFASSGSPMMQQMTQSIMTSIASVRKYGEQPYWQNPALAGTPQAAIGQKQAELGIKKTEQELKPTPSEQMTQKVVDRTSQLQDRVNAGTATPEEQEALKILIGELRPPAVQVNVGGERMPATATKELSDYQTLGNMLSKIEPLMKESAEFQGPGRGWLTKAQQKYGKTPVVGEILGGLPPEKLQNLESETKNAVDILARLRTGAAINNNEFELYSSLLPRIDMPYETNRRNLDIFSQWVTSKLQQMNATYKDLGYRTPTMETEPVPDKKTWLNTPLSPTETTNTLDKHGEPQTYMEFEKIVRELQDPNLAKQYYDKWVKKFKIEK